MWWKQIPEIVRAYSLNTVGQIQFYSVVTLDGQQPCLKSHVLPGCLRNNLAHRWQTGWHLCSQWCWGLKGVTFHRKTSVPADPRLALVRGTFTHHAAGIRQLHQLYSYSWSTTNPCYWTVDIVPEHKHGGDLFINQSVSDSALIGGDMAHFRLLVLDLFGFIFKGTDQTINKHVG